MTSRQLSLVYFCMCRGLFWSDRTIMIWRIYKLFNQARTIIFISVELFYRWVVSIECKLRVVTWLVAIVDCDYYLYYDDDPSLTYFHCWCNDATMTVNVSPRCEYDAAIISCALFVIKIGLCPPGLVRSILSTTSSSTIVVDCANRCFYGCGDCRYHYINSVEMIWNPPFWAYNDD